MASGGTHDSAFIYTSLSPTLDNTSNSVRTYPPLNSSDTSDTDCSTLLEIHTLKQRWGLQEPVGVEDEVSSEVGPDGSRLACCSASPQSLVRVSFSPRKKSILPKSNIMCYQGFTPALNSHLSSGFGYQLSHSASSQSSTPGFISTSQKTSTNSPAMSPSAPTPASTDAPPASISPAPISLSQTINTLRCCGKTFRRPCDLRLAPLPIYLHKSPANRRKTDGTQKSIPDPSNAPSAAPATLTARPSTATPLSTTLTSPRRGSCTTAPSRRVRRNMSQPVATTVSGTLQWCTTRRGDTDEGAGGNQG
jgi:hypothetical protein